MTTATASVTWPTEECLRPVEKALNAAFNAVEGVSHPIGQVVSAYMDKGVVSDPIPSTETIGVLYSFIETLKSSTAALSDLAETLRTDLREIDAMRLDAAAAATERNRGDDAR